MAAQNHHAVCRLGADEDGGGVKKYGYEENIFSITRFNTGCRRFLYVDEFRRKKLPEGSIVYIVPVYGQSLALGEEAQPVTDFYSLWRFNISSCKDAISG